MLERLDKKRTSKPEILAATAMSFSAEQEKEAQTSFLSLPNGCLCCSILEPGITAIENMVAERPDGDKVDWVVVELTGVADPGESRHCFEGGASILKLIWSKPRLLAPFGRMRKWEEDCG